MNKKLVALTVAGVCAAPMAVHAQTANVTLYGRANIDLEFINGKTCQSGSPFGATACSALVTSAPGNVLSNPTVTRVSSNASRFGMRGTESLGGGLQAFFQLESNVNFDTGNSPTSGFASRETYAGLQGNWGKVYMGKFSTPLYDLGFIFGSDPNLGVTILATNTVWSQVNLTKGQGGFNARLGNNVRYESANYDGVNRGTAESGGAAAAIQYSTRDDSGNTTQTPFGGDNGDHPSVTRHAFVIGGNIIYLNGPLKAGVSFEHNQKVRQYTADSFAVSGAPGTSAANPLNANDTDWTITGAYDLDTIMPGFALRLAAVYERTKYDTPSGDLKRDFWGVSATVPVAGGKVYGFYGRASNGKGGAAQGEEVGYVVKGPNTGTTQWVLSYRYSLSPRTLLYTGYVKVANECKAGYTFFNAYPIAVGDVNAAPGRAGDFCSGKPSGAVFGFVHFF